MPPDSSAPKLPSDSPRAPGARGAARPCLICGKPANPRHRPFCSSRCAQIDLGRWLKGNYRIPTDEPPAEGEAEER